MDYLGNTFVTTFWQKTDEPMTPRLVRTIVNSFNLYINSLVAIEALLGGRVEFREDENAYTDLMNGVLKFHVFITPPVPAEVIEGVFEYDPEYLSTLYDAISCLRFGERLTPSLSMRASCRVCEKLRPWRSASWTSHEGTVHILLTLRFLIRSLTVGM